MPGVALVTALGAQKQEDLAGALMVAVMLGFFVALAMVFRIVKKHMPPGIDPLSPSEPTDFFDRFGT